MIRATNIGPDAQLCCVACEKPSGILCKPYSRLRITEADEGPMETLLGETDLNGRLSSACGYHIFAEIGCLSLIV